jgi:hypothetical protein
MEKSVTFVATQYRKEPVRVSFYTKDGKRVSFATDRKVGHKEVVQFTAHGKGKK